MTREEIMAVAMKESSQNLQVAGRNADYFITLEQLERILKSFEK